MPADHLVADTGRDILEAKRALLLSHTGMKSNLKQQVTELVPESVEILASDRICDLVGLFNRIRGNAREILLPIPWAPRFSIPQLCHYFE